jgi:heat shock protein HslJ
MFETLTLTTFLLQAAGAAPPANLSQPEPPPFEGHWVVEVIDNIKVMPDSKVTMRIEGQRVSGDASCNTYQGSFTVNGSSVKVGEFLKTMKTCDGARLSQENDFLDLLREVVRYEVHSRDRLELTTSNRKTITARRHR